MSVGTRMTERVCLRDQRSTVFSPISRFAHQRGGPLHVALVLDVYRTKTERVLEKSTRCVQLTLAARRFGPLT